MERWNLLWMKNTRCSGQEEVQNTRKNMVLTNTFTIYMYVIYDTSVVTHDPVI